MDALAWVEDEVRDRVRRSELDPLAEPTAVRELTRSVIADYGERSAQAGLPLLADADDVVRRVVDAVAGFGCLQEYLDEQT